MGLASHKLNGATNTGADIDDKYNDLIDALLSVFDIDGSVQTYSTTPKMDAIAEAIADAGVTVDGCEIKDGKAADSNKVGGYAYNETEIKPFGSKVSKSLDTDYEADTDGLVEATGYASSNGLEIELIGYIGSSSADTIVARDHDRHPGGSYYGSAYISFSVKKGEHWKVHKSVGTLEALYWRPMGV